MADHDTKLTLTLSETSADVGPFQYATIYKDAPVRRWWQFWKPRARLVGFYDFRPRDDGAGQ